MTRKFSSYGPIFPTGNGQIDLLIRYAGQRYRLELKSFVNAIEYKKGLNQAANYAHQLKLSEISIIFFVEAVDDENRRKFEASYVDPSTSVKVQPIFVATGSE